MTEQPKNFIEAARQMLEGNKLQDETFRHTSSPLRRLFVLGLLSAALAVYVYKHFLGAV